MSSRQERIAKNEATARSINERIEEAHDGAPPGRFLRLLCECGRIACGRVVAITRDEYGELRSDPRQFVVVAGHVLPEAERGVSETDRFVVVVKREGGPAEIAREEDPRA